MGILAHPRGYSLGIFGKGVISLQPIGRSFLVKSNTLSRFLFFALHPLTISNLIVTLNSSEQVGTLVFRTSKIDFYRADREGSVIVGYVKRGIVNERSVLINAAITSP